MESDCFLFIVRVYLPVSVICLLKRQGFRKRDNRRCVIIYFDSVYEGSLRIFILSHAVLDVAVYWMVRVVIKYVMLYW